MPPASTMAHHFVMLARYNAWANERLYAAAAGMGESIKKETGAFFGSMHGTLSHILVADRIWMHRFTGSGETYDQLDAQPYPTLAALEEAREKEDRRILDWTSTLDDAALTGTFTYARVSEPGAPITQRLAPALTHMFNHQTHHRGQAHTILTTLGFEAPAMDMIFFSREVRGA